MGVFYRIIVRAYAFKNDLRLRHLSQADIYCYAQNINLDGYSFRSTYLLYASTLLV
jgi:hypothetical protein